MLNYAETACQNAERRIPGFVPLGPRVRIFPLVQGGSIDLSVSQDKDSATFIVNEFDRILLEQGVSLIPRVPGTKEPPAGFRYADRWDGRKLATLEEMASWSVHDRAAVCGVNHLVVFDFDSEVAYYTFWDQKIAHQLFLDTLVVRTARGFQVWFFDYSVDLKKFVNVVDGKPTIAMEIFLQKHLAAVPNNTHPSGKKYELMGSYTIARKDGIFDKAIERLRSLHWVGSVYSDVGTTPMRIGDLSGRIDDLDEFSSQMAKFWKPGYRNKLLLALAGYLIRKNISEDAAIELIEVIIQKTGDHAARQSAVSKMHYEYRNRHKIKRFLGGRSLAKIALEVQQSCQK